MQKKKPLQAVLLVLVLIGPSHFVSCNQHLKYTLRDIQELKRSSNPSARQHIQCWHKAQEHALGTDGTLAVGAEDRLFWVMWTPLAAGLASWFWPQETLQREKKLKDNQTFHLYSSGSKVQELQESTEADTPIYLIHHVESKAVNGQSPLRKLRTAWFPPKLQAFTASMLKCKSPSWPILSGWDFNHLENTETKRAQSHNKTPEQQWQLNASRGAMVMPHKHPTRWAFCLIKQCSGKFPYKQETVVSKSFMLEPLHIYVQQPCTVGPSQRWTILRIILDWWGAPLLPPLFSKDCCQFHPKYWEKARTHPARNICPKTLAC